ncbi:MAG: hypothetical protein A4E65_03594 [Syntrophorhabdus sp. PtaU1.Bin153]|nr:MAG: hypothetical protein A4E65_03594 [Syntrophorhabdus sp. PtaU1.Bin153]
MSNQMGFSVRIFIPSGNPDGLRIIEKSNWTGQGLVFPRALYAEIRQRNEISRTGVYILWGPQKSGNLLMIYIGEGDSVLSRLDQHAKQKDFWTHAVIFTSKDQNLNKAHVQYIEARLVQLAAEAKRAELDNGNVPQPPNLSEADKADAETFLDNILLCLPIIGLNVFEKAKVLGEKSHDLILKSKGIEARGQDTAEGFVVRTGSLAIKDEAPSIHGFLSGLRRTLLDQGIFANEGTHFRLTQDYTFNSPSTAAGVLLGRSANGRTEWKDEQGRTLKKIQEDESSGP